MADAAEARVETLLGGVAARRQASKAAAFKRWVRKNPIGVFGLALILVLATIALGADALSTHDPYDLRASRNLGISSEHYLGTDPVGADVFSNLLHGARLSMAVGIASVLIGVSAGAILGLVSGFLGGKFDLVVQRVVDAKIAMPRIILALTLLAILGASAINIIIAIGMGYIAGSSRVTRSVVLREKQKVYSEAARAIGSTNMRIMFRHILPNSLSPYLVLISVDIGSAIIAEASLSFLGLGAGDVPSWGAMLSEAARSYYETTPMLALAPGICITFAVLGFNLFGDAIRDTLDPRLRGQ